MSLLDDLFATIDTDLAHAPISRAQFIQFLTDEDTLIANAIVAAGGQNILPALLSEINSDLAHVPISKAELLALLINQDTLISNAEVAAGGQNFLVSLIQEVNSGFGSQPISRETIIQLLRNQDAIITAGLTGGGNQTPGNFLFGGSSANNWLSVISKRSVFNFGGSADFAGIVAGGNLDIPRPSFTKVPTYVGTVVTPSGNTAAALEAASTALRNNGGGTLDLRGFSSYTVGRQVAGMNGLYYDGVPSIDTRGCTSKVVIDARGCTFQTTPGLRFGAFDPATGNPIDIITFANGAYPHPPIYYAAQIGPVIWVSSDVDVEIWGSGPVGDAALAGSSNPTVFDGNINNINIGGLWHADGDGGRALQHYGIWAHEDAEFDLFNGATGKHFCTDALSIGYVGMTGARPLQPQYVENFDAIECGRLGVSYVGGNNLKLVWCRLLRNAMAAYTNGIVSVPASGMDIENETSFDAQDPNSLDGGTFTRGVASDNYGCGVISASGQSRQGMTWNYYTFDAGRGQTAMVPAARYWALNHCLSVGAFNGLLTQQGMIDNGGQGIVAEALVANDTIFSTLASDSLAGLTHEWGEDGAVPGVNTFAVPPQVNLAGFGPKFNRCTFKVNQWVLGNDNTAVFTDCLVLGHQSGVAIKGTFNGTNTFNFPVPNNYGVVHLNFTQAVVNGTIIVNGVTVYLNGVLQ